MASFPNSIYSAITPTSNSPRIAATSPSAFYDGLLSEVVAIETFLGVGGSNVGALISSQVLSTSTAQIAFSNIAGNFNHLRMRAMVRSTTPAEQDALLVRVNGSNNPTYDDVINIAALPFHGLYYEEAARDFGGSIYMSMPGGTATAGIAGYVDVEIPFYADTTWQRVVTIKASYYDAVVNSNQARWYNSIGVFRSTGAITSIQLQTDTGSNLVTGSFANLYGVK
jgi:hypothetical protein